MQMLGIIMALSVVIWYIIDRFKPLWDGVKGSKYITIGIAGILGGKKTSELIPLCHNIPIDKIEIDFSDNGRDELYIYSFYSIFRFLRR